MFKLVQTLFSRELILLGLRDLCAHKLRSLLTALGMIFGVGAVICMLSIGAGTSAEELANIQRLGSNNIILRSVEPARSQPAPEAQRQVHKYGLKREDVARLRALEHVDDVVLLREVADQVRHVSHRVDSSVLGVTSNFFDVVRVPLARGRVLVDLDEQTHEKVCVVGAGVAAGLFPNGDPLGRTISVINRATGPVPYKVVGVLTKVETAGAPAKGRGGRNVNLDTYIPLSTADRRYGDLKYQNASGAREIKEVQFSDIYLSIDRQENVLPVSKMVARVMEHGHRQQDYTIAVPLELLQQAEHTKRRWQIVLGNIAGVSLFVGGIGIMNIMLACVTERTREIGIRRALGAKRYHITAQFLAQTLLLSVCGGLVGILLGVGISLAVNYIASDFRTNVPLWGVLLCFGVSVAIGLAFGLYPACAAARLDPIRALNAGAQST